jgi:thiamine pyrophosphate-dependent acetolactate synthase large subunit-like protein
VLTRNQAIQTVSRLLTDELAIHCNGYIGRESYTIRNRQENFYMIGSMGLASSIGLGLALAQPKKKIVIFDGDGNVLMNLGTLSTIGALQPQNLIHLVFDNGVYGSTGNQPTLSPQVDLAKIAGAAGYRRVENPTQREDLIRVFKSALKDLGPTFIHIRINVQMGEDHGIGRVSHTPREMTDRFRSAILGVSP